MSRRRKFLALSATEKALTLEAAVWLALASLSLKVQPFRRIASHLEMPVSGERTDIDSIRLRLIGHAVARAARHLPWRPVCLPQAMAARSMLKQRGVPSTLYFGMTLEGDSRVMRAHAWLTTGDAAKEIGVIGMPARGEFAVLARYAG